jgi:phenylacetate-CoA ligase
VITTPSGNRLIVHFFTGILEHFTEIDSFQVVQSEPDAILIRIQPKSEITTELLDIIKNALAQRGAEDLQINFELVEEIPLESTGKHRFVINQVDKKEMLDE